MAISGFSIARLPRFGAERIQANAWRIAAFASSPWKERSTPSKGSDRTVHHPSLPDAPCQEPRAQLTETSASHSRPPTGLSIGRIQVTAPPTRDFGSNLRTRHPFGGSASAAAMSASVNARAPGMAGPRAAGCRRGGGGGDGRRGAARGDETGVAGGASCAAAANSASSETFGFAAAPAFRSRSSIFIAAPRARPYRAGHRHGPSPPGPSVERLRWSAALSRPRPRPWRRGGSR